MYKWRQHDLFETANSLTSFYDYMCFSLLHLAVESRDLKFMYSEKATKFCKISTVDLSYVVPVKSTVEISQNFVAFSEYVNFISSWEEN